MVADGALSSLLSDFARTLITDFPIQGILDHLVSRIVEVLPVTGAGVTLIAPGAAPRYIAASDASALDYERLQTRLGQGPCLSAYTSGEPVVVPDLAGDTRFPRFGPPALAAGLAAVFAFPLRHGDERLGALDLYRHSPGTLAAADLTAAQTLADVAAAYVLNAQSRQEALLVSERFRDSALRDDLTGLPNRALLQQRLEHAASRARRSHSTVAVLFADLDRFKRINDTFGHTVGDALLAAVARRLAALVRPGDTLARVSGDEFVFLCEDIAHVSDVELLAVRIGEAFSRPFLLPGVDVVVSASVGIAYSGPGEAITDQLVVDADMAMYQAKRRGGAGHQIIDLRAASQVQERNDLEDGLRRALSGDALELAYQPIVRTVDGLVTGVEALLRWTHPELGAVPALTAVAVAEQSGLVNTLGVWVLRRACRDRARWLTAHPGNPLDLSVNVSALQLLHPGFAATVAAVLDSTGTDPAALVLELTEGIFVEDSTHTRTVLAELKRLGVRVALDDFGTGYCSLGYLRRFPVDMVKIDQGFVADIGRDPAGGAIVAAVTELAHVLGMAVTAEGVETQDQRDAVDLMGCELAQGHHYGAPMSATDLDRELAGDDGPLMHLPRTARLEGAGGC